MTVSGMTQAAEKSGRALQKFDAACCGRSSAAGKQLFTTGQSFQFCLRLSVHIENVERRRRVAPWASIGIACLMSNCVFAPFGFVG